MTKTQWLYFGGAALVAYLAISNSTTGVTTPGIMQAFNLGYNLGHGNGFSTAAM